MIQPRALVFSGSIEVSGLWFDTSLLDQAEIRRRVIEVWRPGTTVVRAPNGVVVRWLSKRRLRVDRAAGGPLVDRDAVSYAAPLDDDERDQIGGLPPGSIVRVAGGRTEVILPHQLSPIDPSEWFDVEAFDVIVPASLGLEPRFAPLAIEPAVASLRQRMREHGVPEEHPDMKRVLDALRGAAVSPVAPPPRGSRWSAFKQRLGLLWRSARATQRSLVAAPAEAPKTSRFGRVFRDFFTRFLLFSRLSTLIGERHARYLSQMMSMFERGDLSSALRHAIPLDKGGGEPGAPAFGVPSPRSQLQISTGAGGPARSLFLQGDLFQELRRLYRAAFERLVREKRLEEAAFVLAELLGESEEAVSFLEKNGKKHLAAELAEARNLAPGLIVRQWFVAGETERAVRLARRFDAFADAIIRLDRTNFEEANRLRVHWAAQLAEAGDFTKAVEIVRPVKDTHQLRKVWLDRAIAVGGVPGARALGIKASLFPQWAAEIVPQVMLLLEPDGREAALEREAFAGNLMTGANDLIRNLARPVFRAQLRDRGLGFSSIDNNRLGALSLVAEDRTLIADLPPLPQIQRSVQPPLELRIEKLDRGTLQIYDAALLPGGKMLVALGEAGVRLLARDGRTSAHFDVPAHALVVSDHGTRALALAPRGQIKRIAKIDLVSKRALDWVDARINSWARTFDGAAWFVADGEAVQMIDVLSTRFEALWRVGEVGGRVRALSRSPASLAFVIDVERANIIGQAVFLEHMPAERWLFELPSLTLRSRLQLPRNLREVGVSPEGRVIGDAGVHSLQTVPEGGWPALTIISDPVEQPRILEFSPTWLGIISRVDENIEVTAFEASGSRRVLKLVLSRSSSAVVRFSGHELVVGDSMGRLLRLGLDPPIVLANYRQ